MSHKELNRLHVIKLLAEGQCTVQQAAERLRLCRRRIQELKKEYMLKGPSAVIHGNRGKVSPKKKSEEFTNKILDLRKDEILAKSNFTQFQELILEYHKVDVSYSTLYRTLRQAEFKSPKSRRRKKNKLHPSRERNEAMGMLLQADATPFQWFGGQERFALHAFIDDATSTVTGLYMTKNECLLGYLEVLRQTLTNFGIPISLYPDRYSVFFVNPKKELDLSVEEQLNGVTKKLTQFGRIIERLGVDMFPAHSPQAKGRIERLWDTLQSRLPIEFALRGITTMEQANIFLKDYLEKHNAQFAVPPKTTLSAFIPVHHNFDLDRLLCAEFHRSLSSGSTISLHNRAFLIEQNKFPAKTKVTILVSEKHGIRALINGAFYPITPIIDHDDWGDPIVGHSTTILLDLIQRCLLIDAKTA